MRKTLVALVAGAMILGGAAIAVAQTDTADDATSYPVMERGRGEHLSEILADMVEEEVITQDQADTLATELRDRLELRRAEREERRAQMQERREGLEAAFSDDVLTVAELDALDAQRILDEEGPFAEALEDGELTRGEFDEIHETLPRRGPGGPHRGGFGGGNA